MRAEKGFTLIELLVSVLILSFVILGASMLFTQAQWYHLGADKRSEIQDHARVIMETMERDLRMIGHGVPKGSDVGGVITYADTWDAIFSATSDSIGFTGDVDNGGTILREDAASTAANQITVDNPTYYANVATTNEPIVLTNNRSAWADLTVNAISGNILTMNANIPSASTFTSEKGEIFTLERVFYRLTGDTTPNDGICDSGYPYCRIERAEIKTNNPGSATETVAVSSDWQTLGDHVYSLDLDYLNASGTVLDPSVAANLPAIAKIIITLECRNRWLRVGDVQSVRMTSHVLVRNRAL